MMLAVLSVGAALLSQDTFQGTVVADSGGCKVISTKVDGTDLRAFLPADLQAGDRISGVVLEADGGTLKPSQKYKITNAGGIGTPVTIGQGYTVGWVITTADNKPAATGQVFVPFDGAIACPATPNVRSSAIVQRGTPITVCGAFDGDLGSTKASTALGPMIVVAESPRATYVMPPAGMSGKFSFTIQEGSQPPVKCETRVVTPLFSIRDPLIKVGESTQANVGLIGLSGIEGETIPLVLTNNSPSVAQLQGGNTQVIEVDKSKLDTNGAFRVEVPVKAIGAGRYELTLQTAMTTGPQDQEEEEPDPIAVTLSGPSKIKAGETATYTANCHPASSLPVCVKFMYVSLGGFIQQMGTDTNGSDGWSAKLDGGKCPEGPGFVYAVAITGQENSAQTRTMVTVGSDYAPPPSFGNGTVQREYTNAARTYVKTTGPMILASVSQVQQYQSPIDQWRKKAADKRQEAADERKKASSADGIARVLESLDRELEGLVGSAFGEMQKLVQELEKIDQKPADKDELKKDADDLADRAKKCQEDCDALQKALDKAKQDQQDLEQQMRDLAASVQAAFLADGWTGRAYFDQAAGIIRWGFVGDGNGSHQINNYGSAANRQINDARKQKRDLAKKLASKKQEIEDLEAKVKDCKENCEKMAKAAQNAQQAAANAQAAAVKQAQIDELCHKIREILGRIRQYLLSRPDVSERLESYFSAMIAHCPHTSKELQDFISQINALIVGKKKLEEEKRQEAEQHRRSAKAASDAAQAADGVADQMEEQQRQAEERAREQAAQRAREQAEAERRAREAAEKARAAEQARLQKEAEDRARAFDAWLKDMMDKGIISSDGQQLIEDLKESLGAAVDLSTSVADGFAQALNQWMMGGSGGQITAAGAAQALTGLVATIYYWWIEAEMRGAIERIKEKLEPRRLQELLVTIDQNFRGQPFGRVDIPMKGNESFFFMRKGPMIIIFKAERGKGLTVCYVGRADGQ